MTKEGLNEQIPVSFKFVEVKVDDDSGALWLHYKVKKVWQKDEWIKEFGLGPKDFVAADNSGK